MVQDVAISDGGAVDLQILLTVPGCPMKDRIGGDVTAALRGVEGVSAVNISFSSMTDQQRGEFAAKVRGGPAGGQGQAQGGHGQQGQIPFAQVESKTKVIAIASGKGGVGKSSITTNLAVALAQDGYDVGVLDADIWGYSIPRMLGVQGRPVAFNNMVMPLQAHGVKVISIGFFIDAERPVIWRGPMLHRALQQFLADVDWGELDFLL